MQKKRLEILNRDEWTCQECFNTEETLNVHHIAYVGEIWETPNDLLITLCETCHEQETQRLKTNIDYAVKELKKVGFTSYEFEMLPGIFNDSRRWWVGLLMILKFALNDKEILNIINEKYDQYLKEQYANKSF